nr:hypothetical protein [Tanacetum cinerariifolium]
MDLFVFINHVDPTKGNGDDDVNKGDGDAAESNQTEQGEHGVDVGGIDVVADDKVQAIIADKPQRVSKKMKAVDGASGSGLPPKKLRKDHGTSGIGVNTGGKSVVALQSLLKGSTLPVEVGVTAVATMPFVTSSVTPDSISETGVRTQHPSKWFMISLYSSHNLNANVADDDVTSVIMSSMPPPPVLTAVFTTAIIVVATYAPVHESANWLKERDTKIANLKAQVSLKETEVANAIHLCGQVAVVEAARASELNGLKEQNAVLEGQMSYDELSVKASSLEFEKDKLVDHTTCSDLRTKVMRYKLFKEQIKAVQDVQVKLVEAGLSQNSSMSDLMALLCLEDHVAETLKAEQLQPSPDQLMLPIHRLDDQVVIGETSLYFSLDLAYARVRKLKESDVSKQLSISDALVLIFESLSIGSLIGEASTSGVPAAIATTTLSTTFVEAGSIPPIPRTKAPPSPIVFEKEELDTTPEHPTAS